MQIICFIPLTRWNIYKKERILQSSTKNNKEDMLKYTNKDINNINSSIAN